MKKLSILDVIVAINQALKQQVVYESVTVIKRIRIKESAIEWLKTKKQVKWIFFDVLTSAS